MWKRERKNEIEHDEIYETNVNNFLRFHRSNMNSSFKLFVSFNATWGPFHISHMACLILDYGIIATKSFTIVYLILVIFLAHARARPLLLPFVCDLRQAKKRDWIVTNFILVHYVSQIIIIRLDLIYWKNIFVYIHNIGRNGKQTQTVYNKSAHILR